MKTFRFLGILAMMTILTFVMVRCSEDEPDPTFTISGNVTYPDFNGTMQPAAGGLAFLASSSEATTEYDQVAIVDEAGNYSFKNLLPGDYFVFCTYDNKNSNLPNARVERAIFTDQGVEIVLVDTDVIHDFPFESTGQETAMAVDVSENGEWSFDRTHSNVDFDFPYDEHNGLFTGRFTGFDIVTVFDPANLAASSITASVDLLTINTNKPGGRDPLYNSDGSFYQNTDDSYSLGCISGYFAVDGIESNNRTSTFTSTTIEEYGDGYLAKGDLTFRGVTSSVNFFFQFQPGYQAPNRSQVLTQYSSFEGYFDMAAKSVFGLESGHVGEADVTIRVTQQVTKALE
jgi:polyisoprenoid-binding protein YceI